MDEVSGDLQFCSTSLVASVNLLRTVMIDTAHDGFPFNFT
jgi:hypothetical protein